MLLRCFAQYEVNQALDLTVGLDAIIFISAALGALATYSVAVAILATVGSRWRFVTFTCILGVCSNLGRALSYAALWFHTGSPNPFHQGYLSQDRGRVFRRDASDLGEADDERRHAVAPTLSNNLLAMLPGKVKPSENSEHPSCPKVAPTVLERCSWSRVSARTISTCVVRFGPTLGELTPNLGPKRPTVFGRMLCRRTLCSSLLPDRIRKFLTPRRTAHSARAGGGNKSIRDFGPPPPWYWPASFCLDLGRHLAQDLSRVVLLVALPPCAVAMVFRVCAFFYFDREATGMNRTARQRTLERFAASRRSHVRLEEILSQSEAGAGCVSGSARQGR